MAVENKWVDSLVEAGKKANPGNVMPGKLFGFACTFEVAAADSDGSIFKLAKLNANLIPLQIKVNADASLGTSAFDLGLYKESGVVADKDLFMADVDLTAGAVMGSEVDGLTNLGVENVGKKLYELLGLTDATRAEDSYVLAFTADTAGGAAGTISIRGLFIQG